MRSAAGQADADAKEAIRLWGTAWQAPLEFDCSARAFPAGALVSFGRRRFRAIFGLVRHWMVRGLVAAGQQYIEAAVHCSHDSERQRCCVLLEELVASKCMLGSSYQFAGEEPADSSLLGALSWSSLFAILIPLDPEVRWSAGPCGGLVGDLEVASSGPSLRDRAADQELGVEDIQHRVWVWMETPEA